MRDLRSDRLLTDLNTNGHSIDALRFRDATTLTIISGAITVTQSYHLVDTEGGAATDDLGTINGGAAGDLVYLKAADGTHTVVLKHGTGNIVTSDGGDCSLNDANKVVALLFDGANWHLMGTAICAVHSAKVGLGTDQSIPDSTYTKVLLDTVDFDVFGEFDITNHRYTASLSGIYIVTGLALWNNADVVANKRIYAAFFVNGNQVYSAMLQTATSGDNAMSMATCNLKLNAGNYVELYVWHNFGSASNIRGLPAQTLLSIARIGPGD